MSQGNMSPGFLNRSDTNRAVHPQNMARGLKFWNAEVEGLIYVAKTKALISCAVTKQLFCRFVFAYAKSRLSHDAAHIFHEISCHYVEN